MTARSKESSRGQPRIDPLQLLKCLGVLLTHNGGIRSREEVQRLASLMMKFSKKLVSKCVYILILKNTETELLGMFMSAGGWTLVFTWLSDGICGKNWALVSELLELLLMCPVDVERLKSNSIPRLVKGLSKDESLGGVNVLATKLVEQWLKIVKDETVPDKETVVPIVVKPVEVIVENPSEPFVAEPMNEVTVNTTCMQPEMNTSMEITPQTFYKVTVRDGKQVIAKVDTSNAEVISASEEMVTAEVTVQHEVKEKKEGEVKKSSRDKDRSKHDRNKNRSSGSSSSSKNSSSSSYSSSNSREKSSSSRDKHRDKSRDRKNRDRDHRSNGSVKSSSSSSKDSKDNKEKQAEKDKATLAKIQPQSVEKLGRIPKKSSISSDKDKSKSDKKSEESSTHKSKPSISIEVRKKSDGDRPKTVKVFNSKLRSTGLEEMAKPPPSRSAVKKPAPTLPSVLPVKRPSPSREAPPPPEKKIKLPDMEERQEKPGGIKLIPPKPKPAFLQESDMFMDALTASATNKKEPKKRKRRTSVTKDNSGASSSSPPSSPSVSNSGMSPLSSPIALKSITAPKFYKDTLETEETKPAENDEEKVEMKEEPVAEAAEPEEEKEADEPMENVVKEVDGIRGVLVYHKRKGPKKNVKWRVDSELEEVQYFELDETERVNVTKTFTDMKQMEHVGEREALIMSRKLPNEDLMDERTSWKALVLLELPPPLAEHGSKSSEKAIQFAREKVILQALYFSRSMLPDSAAEPDIEHHHMTDPVSIPLEDATGNPDSVNDYQNTPWPEPKGSPPHNIAAIPNVPATLFTGGMPPFTPAMGPGIPGNFPGIPQQFAGPGFAPNMMGGDWRGMGDTPVMQPDVMNHVGPVTPNMYNSRSDGYNNMMDENNFPPQNFGPGLGPGPMPGPGPMYQGFAGSNRGNNNRGGFRNMNRGGGWFRPSGPPPGWHGGGGPRGGSTNHWGPGRGGGGAGVCKQFKMQGFCRNRDACPFMHPQGNGPY